MKVKRVKGKVRIGLVQMSSEKDMEANVRKAVLGIKKAAARGARIVALQELFATPYFCQKKNVNNFSLAQTIPGPITDLFSDLACSLKIVIVAPIFEKAGRGVYYNSAVVIDADGKLLGKYRKMHVPYDAGFYEKFYFASGDLGFPVFKTRYAKISVFICYDQWFPEPARLAALKGADILFYPTAIGWKPERPAETKSFHCAWETVQRGHAIANGLYVAAVNRVGKEGALKFWGSSFVAGPFGEIDRRAGADREEIIIADCDLALIEKTRREWPFFRDRRNEFFSGITQKMIKR